MSTEPISAAGHSGNAEPSLKQVIFKMVADRELSAVAADQLIRRIKAANPSFSLAAPPARDDAIAVVGMAGRFGAAADLDAYWQLLLSGEDCLVPPPAQRWATDAGAPPTKGGFLPDADAFDPLFFRISPTEAALMDPQQRLFLEQAYLALENAGYAERSLSGAQCGVYVGAGAGDYSQRFKGTADATNPLGLMGNVASILAARVAYFLNLKGPSIALDTACSSSLVAVHLACEALRAGSVDMALAGGVAVINTPLFIDAMRVSGAISPQSQCRSFDAAADGFVCGEGAGAVVLKRLTDALRDGDHVHGVIRGTGVNQDGRTNGITAPSGPAQAVLEAQVYRRAGIDPGSIGYVEAHGTGTILGDPIEIEGLTQAFREWTDQRGFCAIGSAKAAIGHALTASGVAGLLKVLLMLRHGTIPPQPHFSAPNPRIAFAESPFFVPTVAQAWQDGDTPRRAAVSSFGFSGTNAHVLIEAPPQPPRRETGRPGPHLFVISARTERALAAQSELLAAHLAATPGLRPDDVAYTLALCRTPQLARTAFVADGLGDLIAQLQAFSAGEPTAEAKGGLGALARGFVAGDDITGSALVADAGARRTPLPGCPFDRATYGIAAPPNDLQLLPALIDAAAAVQAGFDPALAARGEGFAAVEAWGHQALAGAYAALGLFNRTVYTQAALRRAMGIVPERKALHAVLIEMLARAGVVRIDGDLVRVVGSAPDATELAASQAALVAHDAAVAPFVDLLAQCTRNLAALLTGRLTAPEILFPGGSMTLVERVYQGNVLADYFNKLLAASVVQAVRHAAGQVEILELGAGTGGATAGILEALAAAGLDGRVQYRMTDVSAAFVQAGRARFGSHGFVSFGLLDLEGEGDSGVADIVVASNVLHATRDIGRTLRRVHGLMKPAGLLLLNEVTALQDFATLTFGLTDGWWAFADVAARIPGSPLLDVARWQGALAGAGFPVMAAFGLPGEALDRMGQAVLAAIRDGAVAARAAPVVATVPQAAAQPVVAGDLVAAVVQEMAAALTLPVDQVDRHGRFMDYGIDSILGVQVVTRLNARFGLDLRPTVLFDHPTAATLARHLAAAHGVQATVPAVTTVEAEDRRIAIVGLSGRFGDTGSLEEFRSMLAEGRSGITEVPPERWTPGDAALPAEVAKEAAYLRWGGFLRDADKFDPLFFRISGREAELTDPQHRVFLTEAWRALEDAGYGDLALDGTRCGVFVGAYGGDYTHRMAQLGMVPEAFAFMGNAASILAGRIAYILNLKGPCLAVDTACSSSLVAVHLACRSLVSGECDMALAGGVFLTTTLGFNTAAAKAGMLSPVGQCKTFDAGADGFVPGEGAGVIVLKRYAQAVADGDHIEAVILASAVNQDGRTNGITAPSPEAQSAVEAEAYALAGIDPAAIGYVEAHGTGTPLGDPIEIEGLTRAFRRWTDRRGFCAIGSVKTNIGHAAHGAGIAGLLKVVLSLRDRQIYPSRNFVTENPILRLAETPFVVNTALRDWVSAGPRIGAVSSFGFSGTNAHIVIQEGPDPAPATAGAGPFLVPVSAKTPGALRQRLADLASWVSAHPGAAIADVSRTLTAGRSHFACRWAAVVADMPALARALAGSVEGKLDDPGARFMAGEEIDLRGATPAGRLISLPGYPFEEQSYWIGAPVPEVATPRATYLAPVWREAAPDRAVAPPGPVAVLGDDGTLVRHLQSAGIQAEPMAPGMAPGMATTTCVLLHAGDADSLLRPMFALLQGGAPGLVLVVGPGGDAVRPLARSLEFAGRRLDLRVVDPGEAEGPALALIVAAELSLRDEDHVRWDGMTRLARQMQIMPPPASGAALRQGGTFAITGGGGVLAGLFGREIARRTKGQIAFIGRRPRDDAMAALLAEVAALGGQAAYWQADVTDAAAVAAALAAIRTSFGPIHGVIHAAGVPGHAVFDGKDWAEFTRVLAPKIAGAAALDAAIGDAPLDFFALFGSLAAELGDFGQGDYAVANAALGGLAAARKKAGRHGVTVAMEWPLWREGRRVLSAEGEAVFLRTAGMPFLETQAGVQALLDGLALDCGSLAVVPGDRTVAERLFAKPETRPMRVAPPPIAATGDVQARITGMVAALLKIEPARLLPEVGFAEFGFDSIALKEFAQVLSSGFGVTVTPAVFFAHGTIGALAQHLVAEHPALGAAPVAASTATPVVAETPIANDAVAIIGMAGRFPRSPDLASFWTHLEAGDDLVGPLPPERLAWQPGAAPPDDVVLRGGFMEDVDLFDAAFFGMSVPEAAAIDPQHRLALETVWRCVEDAGLRMGALAGRDVGVFFGQQVSDYAGLLPPGGTGGENAPGMLPNRISTLFDWRGPSESIDTACSSALIAVHRAARAVAAGECALAVAGGVSLMLSVESLVSTQRLGILSPDGVCRTFDAGANGYVKGEGVGVVLLKPLAQAMADGDVIHAVIRGSAANHGGRAHSLTAPNGAAQTEVIVAALTRAGVASDTIGYVEAHGTGTELGDPVEANALKQAFAATAAGVVEKPRCRIGAVKPSLGHLEPASGMAGLLKVVLAFQQRMIPPTLHFKALNPFIDFTGTQFEIAGRLAAWGALRGRDGAPLPRRAGVSSFGFGGSNAHVVLEEAPTVAPAAAASGPVLLVVSARDRARLAEVLADLAAFARATELDLAAMQATLMLGREAMAARVAILVRPGQSVASRLAGALDAAEEVWIGEGAAAAPDAEEAAIHAELWGLGSFGRLGALWAQGAAIDWAALLPQGQRRMSMPGVRFARTRCWFEAVAVVAAAAPAVLAEAPSPNPLPEQQGSSKESVLARLVLLVSQALYLEPDAIDVHAGFGDLGLDSILAVELTKEVNTTFGTALQATRLYDYATIDALADYVAGHAGAPDEAPAPAPTPTPIPAPPAPQTAVLERLQAMLAAALYLEADSIDVHAGFGDLGLDSILAVEFAKSVNDAFGISLSAARLYDHADLVSLAAYVQAAGQDTAATADPGSDALNFLAARLAALTGTPPAAFSAATRLDGIALEPAQAMALLDELNARFGCALGLEDVGRCRDLGAIVALIDAPAPVLPPPAPPPPAPPPPRVDPPSGKTSTSALAPDVAIVGLACRFPGAIDAPAFWDMLHEGRDGVTAAPGEAWRAEIYHRLLTDTGSRATTWGGYIAEVDRFDPLFFNLSPKDAALMDPQQRLFMEVAWHALEDAGQTPAMLNGAACGIFVGVGQGDYTELLANDPGRVSSQTLLGNTASILTARLAYWLNLKGPSLAVDTACSSSLVAAHLAWKSIRDGECDMALAGGVNLMLTPQMHAMTGASGMLSGASKAGGRCRAFDDAADGFVPGEGIGVVVLKRLDRALADGDQVYAVIAGSGMNQDGKTSSITAPSAASQAALETAVHARHDIPLNDLGLMEAHGTGTKLGDPIEIAALTEAFAARTARRQFCAIGSVKTNIGHTLAAAGVAGLIKLALAFRHRELPGSLHFRRANEHIDFAASPFLVNTTARPWPAPASGRRLAAVSAFGFSGTNAHMVLADAPPVPDRAPAPAAVLVPVSGRSPAALARNIAALARFLDRHPDTPLADIAHTLSRRRTHFAHRAAFAAADMPGLQAQLEAGPSAPASDAARRYVAGETLDWALIAAHGRLVSLPGYAFERTRHWIETAAAGPIEVRRKLEADDPLVAGHVVGGRPILPAAATLGLFHAAAPAAGDTIALSDVAWLRPVVAPASLSLRLTPAEGGWAGTLADAQTGQAFVTARIGAAEPQPPPIDLTALQARCDAPVSVAALDALFAAAGIAYGPQFGTVASVWTAPNEVLAEIVSPDGAEPYPAAALDGALRVAAALLVRDGAQGPGAAPMLPSGADAIRAYARLGPRFWSHVVIDPAATSFRCDVTLLDQHGRTLVAVAGFRSRAAAEDGAEVVYLRPHWRFAPPAPAAAADGAVAVLHDAASAAWARFYAAGRAARLIDLGACDAAALASVREIVVCAWRAPDAPLDPETAAKGPTSLLKLLQGLDETKRTLKIVTRGVQCVAPEDRTDPAFAGILGFAGTAAHEMPWLQISRIDLPATEDPADQAAHAALLTAEPGDESAEIAYRHGQRFRRGLERIAPGAAGLTLDHRAACLIIGGAGGLGAVSSRWLASRFGARIAWVGRRPADATIEAGLAAVSAAGGEARYFQADASNAAALAHVVAKVERAWGPIALAVHAALVLQDRTIGRMSGADFAAAFAAKASALALETALAASAGAPDVLVFSSSNSFTLNRGQANYAAGCTFIDAWARAFSERTGAAVRVINWGFWGEVGAVATEDYRARAIREGVVPMTVTEGLEALDRAAGLPAGQVAIIKLSGSRLGEAAASFGPAQTLAAATSNVAGPVQQAAATIQPEDAAAVAASETALAPLLAYGAAGVAAALDGAGLRDGRGVTPGYARLHRAALAIAGRAKGPAPRPEGFGGMLALLEAGLAGIADVLTGRRPGAEILFPGGSSALVEAVYRDNPLVDRFNAQMAALLGAAAADGALRVLEIGAGTGGASAGILHALAASGAAVEYVYTDVSRPLLNQAEQRFQQHGFVAFRPLDVTLDPLAQGFAAASFDVVVASNVLHATPDVAVAVRHAKALLKRGGVLLLNEVTALSDFATLTFGLTPDWWAFQDEARRLPGSPAMDLRGWAALLTEEGFADVTPVGVGPQETPGQCVLFAVSDGWLPGATTTAPAMVPNPQPAAVAGNAVAYLRTVFAEVLKMPPDAIDPGAPYSEYGVDSLVTQELRERMERDLGPLSGTLLLEHATIASLAGAVGAQHAAIAPTRPIAAAAKGGIAIVGVAGRYPGAADVPALGRLLAAGKSAITEAPAARWDVARHWDPTGTDPARAVGKWGGFLEDVDCFDPLHFGIAPPEAAMMDPQERLFLETVWATLENAGTTRARLHAATAGRVGLFVGASSADWLRLSAEAWQAGDDGPGGTAFWSIANRASYIFDFHGPSLVVDTACSSSLTALHLACAAIERGECQAAVAGGVHLILHPRGQIGLSQMGLMSPTGACHAFDATADGMVTGEGVGAVLLRPLADAERDGDRILGVIRGTGIDGSGRTAAYMLPNPNAQAALIRSVLDRAGIDPATIAYVEAQAVGSPIADKVEVAGLARAFGRGGATGLGSLKPNIGHLEAASGIAQLTKLLLQFELGTLLPTIGVTRLNPEIDFTGTPFHVQQSAAPWPPGLRRAAVSSFGAGGANAHAIIDGPPDPPETPLAAGPFVFPLSARTPTQLALIASRLRAALTADVPLSAVAWTLQTGREALACRTMAVAADLADLLRQLDRIAAGGAGATGAAQAWLAGGAMDWAASWVGATPTPVALPSYPFERRRCWLRSPAPVAAPLPERCVALVVEGPGTIEDLVLRDRPVAPPGPDQVLIETRAFALNFADVLCVSGLYPNLPPYPFVPGMEVAGRVLAVGTGVRDIQVGDDVVALTGAGAHASVVTAAASCVVRKPAGLDFTAAVACPVAMFTVRQAFGRAGLEAGETVLVQSAAGGVGLAAVQMARHAGARVIGVVGTAEKAAYLRAFGVTDVIDRSRDETGAAVRAMTAGRGVDVVLNTRGGADIQLGLDLLAPGGRYVEIALAGLQTSGPLDLSRLIDNQSLITINLGRVLAEPEATRRAMTAIMQAASESAVLPVVGRVFPFAEVAEAYRWLASGNSVGKVVVTMDGAARLPSTHSVMAGLDPAIHAVTARRDANSPAHTIQSPSQRNRVDHRIKSGDDGSTTDPVLSVTTRLVAITAHCFEMAADEIDPSRPLSEYGLNSVLGVAIMRGVREAFGLPLGVTLLWEHPTIALLATEVARLLDAGANPPTWNGPVVPIQAGRGRAPSFWVHGAPGEISWVVALARHLGPDFPVSGIEARGVHDGLAPLESVPDMAALYVDAVLAAQPEGPYWLGGYSAGGPIAFEMIRQLQARGRTVARLVLLDAPAPGTAALRGMADAADGFIDRLAAEWLGERWGLDPLDEAVLAGLDPAATRAQVVRYLADESEPGRGAEAIRTMLDGLDRVGKATGRALAEYRAAPLDSAVEVVLFTCRDGMGGRFAEAGDYRAGWDALFTGPIRRIPVDCDHFRLMRAPWGEAVAAALAELPDPGRSATPRYSLTDSEAAAGE